jgi:hypothetical protein
MRDSLEIHSAAIAHWGSWLLLWLISDDSLGCNKECSN